MPYIIMHGKLTTSHHLFDCRPFGITSARHGGRRARKLQIRISKVHCSGCAGGVYSRAATYTGRHTCTTTATDSMGAKDGMIRKLRKHSQPYTYLKVIITALH